MLLFIISTLLSLFVRSPEVTSAAQYSTECTVEPDGKEVCKKKRIEEKKTDFIPESSLPSSFSSSKPEDIPFEMGGLLVMQKNNDCIDESDKCKEIISLSNRDELCGPTLGIRIICRTSCAICEQGENDSANNSVPLKKTTIGVAQSTGGNEMEQQGTNDVLFEMVRYLREEVLVEEGYENMYRQCINQHELCAFWASVGECKNNPAYMGSSCMLACKKCSQHEEYMY